jgi:hypothetical protein
VCDSAESLVYQPNRRRRPFLALPGKFALLILYGPSHRRRVRITSKRLCRATPSAIQQRARRGNPSALLFPLRRDLVKRLECGFGVLARQLLNIRDNLWPTAGVRRATG